MCEVYGEIIMSVGMVQNGFEPFTDDRTNVLDERSEGPLLHKTKRLASEFQFP